MARARIAVVEDESIVRKDLMERLESLGYEVVSGVATGEDALRTIGETSPDLVLLDIMLRGSLDGVMTAQRIRQSMQIPVIYLTAYSDQETLQRAKVTEPYGYILKPFEEKELHTCIETALYKSKMEKKLRENQQWLSTILKSIGEAVVVTEKNGFITFANATAEQITGRKKQELLGEDAVRVLRLLDGQRQPLAVHPVTEVLRTCSGLHLQEQLLEGKNESDIWITASLSPLKDDQDRLSGLVIVFRDITAEKKIRMQLLHSSRMAGIGTLAGGVAHEFNNLTAIIRAKAEMALLEREPSVVQDTLKCVMASTERAQKITQSLLNFSKRIKPVCERADVVAVLEETLALLERELVKQGIVVVRDFNPVPEIPIDVGQIQQVLLNMLVNARDAMPSGGTLTLGVGCRDGYIRISIGDTGCGIKPEHMERIFEPFFTTKDAAKSSGRSGTGLGLSLSLGIVENHGGSIDINTGSHGTTFTILLPAQPSVSAAAAYGHLASKGDVSHA